METTEISVPPMPQRDINDPDLEEKIFQKLRLFHRLLDIGFTEAVYERFLDKCERDGGAPLRDEVQQHVIAFAESRRASRLSIEHDGAGEPPVCG